MTLIEIAPGVTKEDIRAKTEADYVVSPKLG
jgi:acyl CoA:acetate/3-ketoacid CoA transferase beta subunit